MDFKGSNVNILIVKLSAIGDVIHTLPSLSALRRLYPAAHITWVVEEAASDLVWGHPLLDRVLIFRRKSWMADVKAGRLRSAWRGFKNFLADLQSRRYDLVIDFHGLLKSSIVVFLSGGERKLGYDSWQEASRLFLTEKIPEDMNKHAVDRYLDFPRHLGADVDPIEFVLPLTDEAFRRVETIMRKHGLLKKQFIAISPEALWDTKLWNRRKFATLADAIQQTLKIPVVFTGHDKEPLDNITAQMVTKAVHLGGQTSLRELACLYSNALLVVTTDSGPMHLAAAVGTPVVALFGPTDPNRTGPYGKGHAVIRTGITCSPCFKKTCKTRRCMEDIAPEDVLKAVRTMADHHRRMDDGG